MKKITELDEVTVSSGESEKFLQLQNEEFKQYAYETDATGEVQNIAFDPTVRGMPDGLNFVNIFKALFFSSNKDNGEVRTPLKKSVKS